MNCAHFAKKIKELRVNGGYTIASLAKALSVGVSRASMWESCGAVPHWDVLLRVAHFFGVTVDELLEEQAKEPVKSSRTRGFSGKFCTRR